MLEGGKSVTINSHFLYSWVLLPIPVVWALVRFCRARKCLYSYNELFLTCCLQSQLSMGFVNSYTTEPLVAKMDMVFGTVNVFDWRNIRSHGAREFYLAYTEHLYSALVLLRLWFDEDFVENTFCAADHKVCPTISRPLKITTEMTVTQLLENLHFPLRCKLKSFPYWKNCCQESRPSSLKSCNLQEHPMIH